MSRVHRLQSDIAGWLVGVFLGVDSVSYKPPTLNLHNCYLLLSMTKQNLLPNSAFKSGHGTLETQSLLRLGTIYAVYILIVTNILIGNYFLNQLEHKNQYCILGL